MYKIGDFSKIVGLPVKTIRYYDTIDLLKPNEIDVFTDYRYYNDDNVLECQNIIMLKSVGFSLKEIKLYLNNLSDNIMLRQKEILLKELEINTQRIKDLDNFRSKIINGRITVSHSNSLSKDNKERNILWKKR